MNVVPAKLTYISCVFMSNRFSVSVSPDFRTWTSLPCCLHGCWYAVPGPYVRGEETTLTDDIQHRLPSAAAECSIQPIRNDDFERPTWLKSFRHKLCV